MNKNDIYYRIREARKKTGLSQSAVAKKAGLSQASYSRIEDGTQNPNFEKLQAIAEQLNVSTNWLLYGTPKNFDDGNYIVLPDGLADRIRIAAEKKGHSIQEEVIPYLEKKYPSSPYEYLIDAYLADENIEQYLEDELRGHLRNALPRFETDGARKRYIKLMIDVFKKMQNGDF